MDVSLKILILEDVPEDVGLIEHVLKRDGIAFSLRQVDTRAEFIDAMEQFAPDIILSDHALPQFNSIQALKLCKEQGRKIPFILVTGTVSEEFAVNCLKQGADDYVLKSNLSRLPSAIHASIRHHNLEDEKRKAEDHLLWQNAELIKINKELDSFVYNVSHNLRSPLASILGLIHLIKKENDHSSVLTQYFSLMETSVHKLDNTLKEILDYSQNNRNEITKTQIDFESLLNNCLKELTFLPGRGEIETRVTLTGNSPFYSDAHRLQVLLHNLISNSANYRDLNKDRQFIRVSVTISPAGAIILFEDNGIGIEETHLPKVFDMFYRATEHSDGAGLGLYIAKEIVNMLKGYISVESKVLEGTTLTITIPNLSEAP